MVMLIGLDKYLCGRLTVFRARFSALIPREIHRACETLVQPNE